ncbi:MAG TPA: hypothetical protein VH458_12900 [Vicinamibacterales bacterium]
MSAPRAETAEAAVAKPSTTSQSLDGGWAAIGVAPGSTDHRLAGLERDLLPARAPGTAATALGSAGLALERDLDGEDWWFRCRFDAAGPREGVERVLRLGGIATLADVWLNGEHLLSTENMYLSHGLPVEGLLREENELVIGVRALSPLLAPRRPRPRWRTRLVREQGLRWFRTTLAGRIPSFSPGPAPVGPWRTVELETHRDVVVERVRTRATIDGRDGIVSLRGELRLVAQEAPQHAAILVTGPTGETVGAAAIELRGATLLVDGEARVPAVDRWWPHTHGEPALYDVSLRLEGPGGHVVQPCGRVGFRDVAVPDTEAFAVEVNGEPIFCRGASLVPDRLAVDLPAERLRAVLERARDAGMNMVRLPGVGPYGSDAFYDLCDELGLLVWQDFPFASLDYPIEDDAFRATVEREVEQFLDDAGRRASLAVLCGSSEVEQQAAMLGLDPALGRGPLFEELLPQLISAADVTVPYVTSSPSGGSPPIRVDVGVGQYFGVGAYRRPLADARRAEVRFAAECLAFASVPSDETLAELAAVGVSPVHDPAWKRGVPRDSGAGWDFDDVRDHYVRELFAVDPDALRAADPDTYLDLARVTTGEVTAATLGEWRRARSGCGGALVWTLNDVLPGAGWGLLDSSGRPKAAYWYARRALAPIATWLTDEGLNGVAVHVANDGGETLRATLTVRLHADGERLVEEASTQLELARRETVELSLESILGRFADAAYAYRFGPPGHDVVSATLAVDGVVRSEAVHFPLGRPFSSEPVDRLGLAGRARRAANGAVSLEVSSRRLAYAVALDAPGFAPDDDFFTILPGGTRKVRLAPTGELSRAFAARLRPLNGRGSVTVEAG